jgi:hypothetical protein
MILLLLVSIANAGKLQDGWRGHPYGDSAWLDKAPFEGCKPHAEDGVRWLCDEIVGGQPVAVAYMVAEGFYTGIVLRCNGYVLCKTVLETLGAAWGRPFSIEEYGSLPERFWRDGTAMGSWDYNQFSEIGTATTFDSVIHERVDAIKAAKAKSAAGDL